MSQICILINIYTYKLTTDYITRNIIMIFTRGQCTCYNNDYTHARVHITEV